MITTCFSIIIWGWGDLRVGWGIRHIVLTFKCAIFSKLKKFV
jgi:hypothetical protein